MMNPDLIKEIVAFALEEDVGAGDVTAALLSEDLIVTAEIMGRERALVCGQAFVESVFHQLDPSISLNWLVAEGDFVEKNTVWCRLTGPVRHLLTGERCALNFLQTLSGTATTVHQFVSELKGTNAQLLDTRKTIPGLRQAQKYAVRCGGGINHRQGLYDAFLIKENHISACGSIAQAIHQARNQHADLAVIVEVEDMQQLQEAIEAQPDRILLDNFERSDLQHAVTLLEGRIPLEASGNIDLKNIREVAETGVDFISVGSITKNMQVVDLSMLLV